VTLGAIDLLFAAKPEIERLHQASLKVLFERTPLLEKLTGIALKEPEVEWEPEKGTFDLLVRGADRQGVLLELKVDALLSRRQILDQVSHPLVASGYALVYVLLGASAVAHGARWGQWKWILGDRPPPRILESGDLVAALRASVGPDSPPGVRELAESHARVVAELAARTRGYAGKLVAEFGYHDYLGFFDELRQAVDFGGGSTVGYVSNPAGGFVCCAWEGVPTRLGGMYLQFEDQSLCLKLWVDDMAKDERPKARRDAVEVALKVAETFPRLLVEATRGRSGESMTLARLAGVMLVASPRDEQLLANLREAQEFVRTVAAAIGPF